MEVLGIMESQVAKMYENAGVGKQKYFVMQNENYKDVFEIKYPPFTAEKQLGLIKWLSKRCFYIEISEMMDKSYGIALKYQPADEYKNEQSECCVNKNFTEALAESINYIWQDLTDQERTEIAEILK